MSNELVIAEGMTYEQMAELTGQSIGGGNLLPALRINNKPSATIDGKKYRLDPGVFVVDYNGKTVYSTEAEPVTFRVLMQSYQYLRFDENAPNKSGGKGAVVNKSVLGTKLGPKHEYPDEFGGDRCGKIKVPEGETVSAEQAVLNKQTSVYRMLFGLVSFKGKTAQGEVVEVVNAPVQLKRRGQDFMTFSDEVEKPLGKMSASFLQYAFTLSTEERENGSTIYYLVHFAFDRTNKLALTADLQEPFNKFKAHITEENRSVMAKHVKALSGGPNAEEVNTMRDIDEPLPGDLDDEIPF